MPENSGLNGNWTRTWLLLLLDRSIHDKFEKNASIHDHYGWCKVAAERISLQPGLEKGIANHGGRWNEFGGSVSSSNW